MEAVGWVARSGRSLLKSNSFRPPKHGLSSSSSVSVSESLEQKDRKVTAAITKRSKKGRLPYGDVDEDYATLIKIRVGLQGGDPKFGELTEMQAQRAMIIIQKLYENDTIWRCLTDYYPTLDRRRLPRLQVRLSQSSGLLPPSLFIEVESMGQFMERTGGQANIFSARLNGNKVAVKELRIFQNMTKSERTRVQMTFSREAILWSHLRHRNVIRLLGLKSMQWGAPVMIMPWYRRGSVMNFLTTSKSRPTVSQLNKWLLDVATGLKYLHMEEIVHGDLRGANVLLSDHGDAVLTDFGLAVFASEHSNALGSLRGGSELCDLFSFACLCIELYTQEAPFAELTIMTARRRVTKGERPPCPSAPAHQSMCDELWDVVQLSWRHLASERPTADFVATAMQRIASS
ncbi:unnamed protein product [Somion occarium]|uniref:Protein kinase domain-containing protein n=1 Tax=Somion occarium TaxID=3059160 RepID=A0ABP1CH11_9APHY